MNPLTSRVAATGMVHPIPNLTLDKRAKKAGKRKRSHHLYIIKDVM